VRVKEGELYYDSLYCRHISTEPTVKQCLSVTLSMKNPILDTLWMENCYRSAFHSQEFIISSANICIAVNNLWPSYLSILRWSHSNAISGYILSVHISATVANVQYMLHVSQ